MQPGNKDRIVIDSPTIRYMVCLICFAAVRCVVPDSAVYAAQHDDWATINFVGNVPSQQYYSCDIDVQGFVDQGYTDMRVLFEAVNDAIVIASDDLALSTIANKDVRFGYAGLADGQYDLRVTVYPAAVPGEYARATTLFKALSPVWLDNTIGIDPDRVLKPWTPLTTSPRSVSAWGRTVTWNDISILPAGIITQNVQLLAAPIKVIIRVGGVDHVVPLHSFAFDSQSDARVELTTTGIAAGITCTADMHMDFDGFLWVVLSLNASPDVTIEQMTVQAGLVSHLMERYQCYDREKVGPIEGSAIHMSWLVPDREHTSNFYHWFGNEDLGIGFTYETLEHWQPASEDNFCTYTPDSPATGTDRYTMNLIESPVQADGRKFLFGIQATPIKPLPPSWHSTITDKANPADWRVMNQNPERIDYTVIWGHSNGWGDIQVGLHDPEHFIAEPLNQAVAHLHGKGIAAAGPAVTPQKIQPTMTNFYEHFLDWKRRPESYYLWDWEGVQTDTYIACARSSSYIDFVLYHWKNNVETFNLDGVYFDGWLGAQMNCTNQHHGCGYRKGDERQPTIPVLESREAMKRIAIMLEDTVNSQYLPADESPPWNGFPQYVFWVHEWQFCPPLMGFATAWYSGEWASLYANDIGGGGFAEWLGAVAGIHGLDMLKTRCLSTNYGIPIVMVHNRLREIGPAQCLERQTKMALAWELPHGIPQGTLGYMNQRYLRRVYDVMSWFGTRSASFTPAWKYESNSCLEWVTPPDKDDVFATWQRSDGTVLAVISNLRTFDNPSNAVNVALQWIGGGAVTVTDAIERTPISVDTQDNSFSLHIEPETFRLLWISSAGGDFDHDLDVDTDDLSYFTQHWLTQIIGHICDFNGNGIVSLSDFAQLVSSWSGPATWLDLSLPYLLTEETFEFGSGISPTWNYIDDHTYHTRLTNTNDGQDKYARFAQRQPRVNTDIPLGSDDNWVGKVDWNSYPDGKATYAWIHSLFGAAEGYDYVLYAKVASVKGSINGNGIAVDIRLSKGSGTDITDFTTIARIANDTTFDNLVSYNGITAVGTPMPAFAGTWYDIQICITARTSQPDIADYLFRPSGTETWTILAEDIPLTTDLDTLYSTNTPIYCLQHKYGTSNEIVTYIDTLQFYQVQLPQ